VDASVLNRLSILGGVLSLDTADKSSLFMKERAARHAAQAGFGQLWWKTDGTLMATDDNNVDTAITLAGGGLAVSDIPDEADILYVGSF